MEEINLDLGSNKTISLSNNDNNDNSINVLKDSHSEPSLKSDIGLDLLINKSKTGGGGENKIEQFKPSEPVKDSISPTTIKLDDIGSKNSDLNISLNDDLSLNSNSQNISSSSNESNKINLDNTSINIDSNKSNDLDFNLDSLLDDKPNESLNNSNNSNSNSNSNISSNENIFSLNESKKEPVQKSYETLQKEKAEYLRLLERLEDKGITSHKKFNMNSDYNEVKSEFDRLSRRRECNQSVKFQRKMLIAIVTAIEFLNTKFDPFDVKLEGWSESVHENVGDYDDIFEELHEKYKEKAQMAPELKLLLMLGGSGFMFHLTNTMFKSSLPGMGDIMKQNPELMKQFTQAATSTMNKSFTNSDGGGGGGLGSGFSNLMGSVMGNQAPRKEMSGPPDINDILNNMKSNNNVNIDMNTNFSESEMEGSNRNINLNSNNKSINLDI